MTYEADPIVIDQEYQDYLAKYPNKPISVEEFQLQRLEKKYPNVFPKVDALVKQEQTLLDERKRLEKQHRELSKLVQEKNQELTRVQRKLDDYILSYCMCGSELGGPYCFNEETGCD